MKTLRILYHLARADFLERVRRYGFLVTLAAAAYFGWSTIAGYSGMDVGGYRGVYNSAWIGTMVAMTTCVMVTFVGFYIVKNTVERDRQTGVGQILATTPMGRAEYLLGKFVSNTAVFCVILAVMAVAAIIMQGLKGEERHIDFWALLNPFLLVAVPAVAFVGALAVFFETVPGLRGGFGNIAYFFLWGFLLAAPITTKNTWADLICLQPVQTSVMEAAKANYAEYKGGFSIGIGPRQNRDAMRTFLWKGVDWTPARLGQRLGIVFAALGLVVAPALWFDRFDPARRRRVAEAGAARRPWLGGGEERASEEVARPASPAHSVHLTPLVRHAHSGGVGIFARLVLAELRLMLKGLRVWWYLAAAGLLVAQAVSPLDGARSVALGLAWIWPVLLWSKLGTRESLHATDQMIFSSAHTLRRQLPAMWVAGVIVAMLTGSAVGLRLLISDAPGAAAWLVGALFIPSLALACGVWSRSSKLFEIFYTFLWYAGPMNHAPVFDYFGATPAAIAEGRPLVFLFATAVLVAAAVVGRQRQLRPA